VPDASDLRPGDPEEIAGYRIVRRLGAGGQGVVYLATALTGEQVAIKQLRAGLEDERAKQQLTKEVAAARRVAPFCTASVVDADLDGPSPYVISEYIDGPSLQQLVQRDGPLSGTPLHRLAIGTATALAAIHQAGVVHRDFKPANVMMAADGPRVIDFGIARDLSTETTVTSRIFGTPAYMAPEQLRAERIGPATDMFAWASVIAFAATGRAPFEAPHMMAVVHRITSTEPDLAGVPEDLLEVLRRCLDKDPAARPTAQQALALVLGRPAPTHDVSDATQVLAEATGLMQAARTRNPTRLAPANAPANAATALISGPAAAPTTPYSPAAPAPTRVAASSQDWGSPPPAVRDRPAPASPSGGGRGWVLAIAGVVVVLLLGGWGLKQAGLIGAGTDDGSSSSSSSADPTTPSTGQKETVVPVSSAAPTDGYQSADPTSAPAQTSTEPTDSAPASSDDGYGATVPDAFDGKWEGQAHQPNGKVRSWTAKIELEAGDQDGSFEIDELDCSGQATVVSATDQELTLDAVIDDDEDGSCAPHGTIRLIRNGTDSVRFGWQDASVATNRATGILTRD
jgi:serine/threonine protein kinase